MTEDEHKNLSKKVNSSKVQFEDDDDEMEMPSL